MNSDCSCHPSCSLEGNCCTDYNLCERLIVDNAGREQSCNTLSNCELCEFSNNNTTCRQCRAGFYLRDGLCVGQCGSNDAVVTKNFMCRLTQGI